VTENGGETRGACSVPFYFWSWLCFARVLYPSSRAATALGDRYEEQRRPPRSSSRQDRRV